MQELEKQERFKSKSRGRQYQFDAAHMRMVVREFLISDLNWLDFAQKHGISVSQLKGWVRKFSSDLSTETPTTTILTEQESKDVERLRTQNEELAKKLTLAQMQITGLEFMIDFAEEQLNINIRKKPGTKQSEG